MLSEPERRVLVMQCFDHAVATCDTCRQDYKFSQLGVDVIGRRYYFCPLCRLDLVDLLRTHLLGCTAIAATLQERTERSRQLIKTSHELVLSSAILAAESEHLAQHVLDTMRRSRHVSPPSETGH